MAGQQRSSDLEQHVRQLIQSNEPSHQQHVVASPFPPFRPADHQSWHGPNGQPGPVTNGMPFAAPGPQQYMHNQNSSNRHNGRGRGQHFAHGSGNDARGRQYQHMNGPQRGGRQWHGTVDSQSYNRGQSFPQQFTPHDQRGLYNPSQTRFQGQHNQRQLKSDHLETLANRILPQMDMTAAEHQQKEAFRVRLQQICHDLCSNVPTLPHVNLQCFGSFQSGFATAGSDMDLVIVNSNGDPSTNGCSLLEEDLPRALEKALLEAGIGARLLTRTRVPIIKICEKPSDELLAGLKEERQKWEALPDKDKYPHLVADEEQAEEVVAPLVPEDQDADEAISFNAMTAMVQAASLNEPSNDTQAGASQAATQSDKPKQRMWAREKKSGALDFPKEGVGIQSDINFFNPLGLHNTQMLRCYSLCDPRVRPMVLFVKSWAKKRKINSAYSGTLSSYGYVLMVLHYLVNVSRPPVLPNLQAAWRPSPTNTPATESKLVDKWNVAFWDREDEITEARDAGLLTRNNEPLGSLLSSFFYYYGQQTSFPNFNWMKQVLSLRTPQGIRTKEEKEWVKARTEEGEGRKVQYRYLFCIEDPFELDHNVARTVTHNGIVTIRDEFRRAVRILQGIGNGMPTADGELFDELLPEEEEKLDDSRRRAKPQSSAPAQRQANQGPGRQMSPNVQDNSAFPALGEKKAAVARPGAEPSSEATPQTATAAPRGRGRGRGRKRQTLDLH